MNFDPFALIVFLDLNVQFLQPFQLLDSPDVSLERLFAFAIEAARNHSPARATELVPIHYHHNQHDQIEQRQLEDNEHNVSNQEAEHESKDCKQRAHAA